MGDTSPAGAHAAPFSTVQCAEAPDSILEPFLRQLKEAMGERGARADEALQPLTGTNLKRDATA